jgi:hypothetical protein
MRGYRIRLEGAAPTASRGAYVVIAMDDEEQPARHASALAAARRRAWSSLANVALLRLPRCDSGAARAPSIGSWHTPTSGLCTGRNRSGQMALPLVVQAGNAAPFVGHACSSDQSGSPEGALRPAPSGKRTPVSSSETSQRRRATSMAWAAAERPASFGAPRCSMNPPGPAKLLPGVEGG